MVEARRWGTIGGDVVLDLVDTQSWRFDAVRRVDRMPDVTSLIAWAADRGLISHATAESLTKGRPRDAGSDAALARVHGLRDVITRVLDAQIAGTLPEPAALDWLRLRWQEALAIADVQPELPLTWTIDPRNLMELAQLVALRCGDFLRTSHPRLRCCDGPGCGWLFLDTSRNHSRRWCDPQDCGNRVRVARHSKRHIKRHPRTTNAGI